MAASNASRSFGCDASGVLTFPGGLPSPFLLPTLTVSPWYPSEVTASVCSFESFLIVGRSVGSRRSITSTSPERRFEARALDSTMILNVSLSSLTFDAS